MNPTAEQMDVPPDYPVPSQLIAWETVSEKLRGAPVYWLASVRPDGRPHLVPRDGTWLDDALYYGGSPETVHARNVGNEAPVTMHIGDGQEAVIVEGVVRVERLSGAAAVQLAGLSSEKYPQYGQMDPAMYADGVLVLRPTRVLAWTSFGLDATRFRFA